MRCGDNQGCKGGQGAVYGLAISMAPDCLTPYYPGGGQPIVCGNWGVLSCPGGSVPIPPAYGMLLQVNWQAMPVSFDREAAFEAMNNCAASGDGLTLAEFGRRPSIIRAVFFEAYESGHWVSQTQSGGGTEPIRAGLAARWSRRLGRRHGAAGPGRLRPGRRRQRRRPRA